MKKTDIPFIPYRNYGMGFTTNLVLSYLTMYPETNVSNDYLSDKLDMSTRQIRREIKLLFDKGIIDLDYPNRRKRVITLLLKVKDLFNNDGHIDHQVMDNESTKQSEMMDNESSTWWTNSPNSGTNSPSMGTHSPSMGTDSPSEVDKESIYKKYYNKPHNKVDNNSLQEITYKKETKDDIMQSIIEELKKGGQL